MGGGHGDAERRRAGRFGRGGRRCGTVEGLAGIGIWGRVGTTVLGCRWHGLVDGTRRCARGGERRRRRRRIRRVQVVGRWRWRIASEVLCGAGERDEEGEGTRYAPGNISWMLGSVTRMMGGGLSAIWGRGAARRHGDFISVPHSFVFCRVAAAGRSWPGSAPEACVTHHRRSDPSPRKTPCARILSGHALRHSSVRRVGRRPCRNACMPSASGRGPQALIGAPVREDLQCRGRRRLTRTGALTWPAEGRSPLARVRGLHFRAIRCPPARRRRGRKRLVSAAPPLISSAPCRHAIHVRAPRERRWPCQARAAGARGPSCGPGGRTIAREAAQLAGRGSSVTKPPNAQLLVPEDLRDDRVHRSDQTFAR
jgi:hypothetical protein